MDYIERFAHLNMNQANGQGKKSPHKVAMLLAVMDLIKAGHIFENKIYLDEPLKERFSQIFEQLKTSDDRDTPENPFFHLSREGFWHIKFTDGVDPASVTRYVKKNIQYAYLDDELFELFKSPISVVPLKDALTENLSDLPELFRRWLLEIGKSEKTAKNYLQAVHGSISNWLAESDASLPLLHETRTWSQFSMLADKARQLAMFAQRDKRSNGRYSAALNSYQRFLADLTQQEVQADVQSILANEKLTSTERSVLVNARMGQGIFRKQLIDYWQGCAVTHYRNTLMLVASHIKPWRSSNDEERLSRYNGLLLLANLDKAFDLGFISFQDDGLIMISKHLEKPDVLGITEDMRINVCPEHRPFLDHHRYELFKAL